MARNANGPVGSRLHSRDAATSESQRRAPLGLGQLQALGILRIRRDLEVVPPGQPFLGVLPAGTGSTIAILGPGWLWSLGRHRPTELRAGRLTCPLMRFVAHVAVRQLLMPTVAALFQDRLRQPGKFKGLNDPSSQIQYWCETAWQRLIQNVRQSERGGAFVIAPAGSIAEIQIGYTLRDVGLGDALIEAWDACLITDDDALMEQRAVLNWRDNAIRLEHTIDALSRFALADGCVVLDDRWRALGFGAKLSSEGDLTADLRFVDPETGRADPDLPARIMRFGTRHRSAFRYCCKWPGAVAVVISQDGDVRIFGNKGGEVFELPVTDMAPPQNLVA